VRELFAAAEKCLGFDLGRICFSGPEAELNRTAVTQPAVFVHSVAAWRQLAAAGMEPRCVAGHSLGEYSALVAAGALEFATGLELVRERSRLMQRAGEVQPGSMAAIIGLEDEQVEELCGQASAAGTVVCANFNAPGQVAVSGAAAGVEKLGELARQAGAKRVIPLAVSGAFHSPLMEPAARNMAALLQEAPLQRPRLPVITNVGAELVDDPEELRQQLVRQMTHPVRWTASIRRLGQIGVRRAFEVGPGAVLKGLARRIDRKLEVVGAGGVEDIAAAIAAVRQPN
jgi:[acyl-carrier-protein] S-malonyltransferase